MARLKKGINGPISGKIGNVVGSSWNGIDYIRSLPQRRKPFTQAELKNQFIFKLSQEWLQPILPFVRIGFKGYSQTSQGFNAAKSYLSRNALIKDGFDSYIDPALVMVSYGDLPLPGNIQVEKTGPTELTLTWDPSIVKNSSPNDQVMLLAYNIAEPTVISSGNAEYVLTGQFRKNGEDKLIILSPAKEQLSYHIYVAFVAADRDRQSNSVYLGAIDF